VKPPGRLADPIGEVDRLLIDEECLESEGHAKIAAGARFV
jgi:hypothetical protein